MQHQFCGRADPCHYSGPILIGRQDVVDGDGEEVPWYREDHAADCANPRGPQDAVRVGLDELHDSRAADGIQDGGSGICGGDNVVDSEGRQDRGWSEVSQDPGILAV